MRTPTPGGDVASQPKAGVAAGGPQPGCGGVSAVPRERSCKVPARPLGPPHSAGRSRHNSSASEPGPVRPRGHSRTWAPPGVRADRQGQEPRREAARAQEMLTEAGPAVRVEPEAGLALAEVGAWRVHTPVMAAAIVHLALIHIWAGTEGRGLRSSTHPGAEPRDPSGTPHEDTAPGPGDSPQAPRPCLPESTRF